MNVNPDELSDLIVNAIADAVDSPRVQDRFVALETRIAELEAKPYVRFRGVWKPGTYQPGDAATHHGGLWVCMAATSGEPTKDFVGWQLAVKRGAR